MGILHMFGKTIAFLLILLVLSLPVPVVASPKLVIISPHQDDIKNEWKRAFQKWYKGRTGQDVVLEWLDQGGASDDLRFVLSEFSKNPDGIRVDVFWGGGVAPFIKMKDQGLLHPYKLPDALLAKIPKDFSGIPMYDPDYTYYGSALSGFGIIYNKVVLKMEGMPEPQTWEDLSAPVFRGWVGSADPRHSASMHMTYSIILQAYGWEKGWDVITRLGANVKNFTRSSADVPRDVAFGDVVCGLAIDFYAWPRVERHGPDKIGYVLPEDQTVINPDAIAILKGAPNMDVAEAFVNFVMSEEGQSLWMLPKGVEGGPAKKTLGRLSVIPSLYDTFAGRSVVPVNPFKMSSTVRYDAEKGAKLWPLINDLMGTLILDTHDELTEAWEVVVKTGMKPAAVAELTRMPITEMEALDYAEKWRDSVFRNQKINEWVHFAIKRARKAKALAKGK